jgi:hypothetical protein
MKGMELPINMIVVILIAVLVLVTVGAFLASQMSNTSSFGLEQAFGEGCQKLRSVYNCDLNAHVSIKSYTPPGRLAGSGSDFFADICSAKGFEAGSECAIACGCPRP